MSKLGGRGLTKQRGNSAQSSEKSSVEIGGIVRRQSAEVGVDAFLSLSLSLSFSSKNGIPSGSRGFRGQTHRSRGKMRCQSAPSRAENERGAHQRGIQISSSHENRPSTTGKKNSIKQPKPADADNDPRIARAIALRCLLSPAEMLREDGTIDQDFFKPKQVR